MTEPTPATEYSSQTAHNALPVGTRIGEFEITGLVGVGGFGIVYRAVDHSLQREVALKEYMPNALAQRAADGTVTLLSGPHREAFEAGRSSFVNEARLLAQFDHPSLLKVYRFWEAGGTAYMVMPLYEGKTLRQVLDERPVLDEAWIRNCLASLMDALEVIHNENCFHRDISPENIMLLEDDRPVLLDFGAARRVIGGMTQALTVFVKHSYAPIEQYAEMPEMRQGAWTDIYTLAALAYLMVARKLPPPSVNRIVKDNYEALVEVAKGRYSEPFLAGLDICLRVRPEDRPQSIAEMRTLLGIRHRRRPSSSGRAEGSPAPRPKSQTKPEPAPTRRMPRHLGAGLALGAILAIGGTAFYLGQRTGTATAQPPAPISAPVATQASARAPKPSKPAAQEALAQKSPAGTSADRSEGTSPEKKASDKVSEQKATKRKSRKSESRSGESSSDKSSSGESKRKSASKKNSGKDETVVSAAKKLGHGVADWAKRTFGGK